MKRLALVAALALAGCAHDKPPSRPNVVPVKVDVPIRVPCKRDVPASPAYAADTVALDANIFDLVKALLVDREQRKARETELTGVIESCW